MCMGQQKRNRLDFLSENNISELPYIKNNVAVMFM